MQVAPPSPSPSSSPPSTEDWLEKKIYPDENSGMAWPHEVVLNVGAESLGEKIFAQVWTLHVEDEIDVANLIQTEAELSYAKTVMDRIGCWIEGGRDEDGSQIGGRPAASMWIYTKAVICNGQQHTYVCRNMKKYSMIEAVSWVCTQVRENHEWFLSSPWRCRKNNILEALIEISRSHAWSSGECCGILRPPASTTTC